jgi:phosphoribosylformylglycinamidine cyclo-ligase
MRQYGVGITSTGGETADVGDLVRTVIVDSTVASRMPRKARGSLTTSTQRR